MTTSLDGRAQDPCHQGVAYSTDHRDAVRLAIALVFPEVRFENGTSGNPSLRVFWPERNMEPFYVLHHQQRIRMTAQDANARIKAFERGDRP